MKHLEQLARRLELERYPRSRRYDAAWVQEHMMGPHPLWLMEHLTGCLELEPGARVLDLGCGKALTSIFLARELGVSVVALDLWIPARENAPRIAAAGAAARVAPIHADARALPFTPRCFDAILSVDAYHYFGTDPGYLAGVVPLLRPGGRVGIVCPGLTREIEGVPETLAPYWEDGFSTFHTGEWWRRLWESTGLVTVERAELVPHGAEDWLLWAETWDEWERAVGGKPYEREAAMLRADRDGLLGFVAVVATPR